MKGEFVNEPIQFFTDADSKAGMQAALDKVGLQLGAEYPLIIGGRKITIKDKFESTNPAKPSQVIGVFQKAGEAEETATATE